MVWSAAIATVRQHRESLLIGALILSLAATVVVEAMPTNTPEPLAVARSHTLPKIDVTAADATRPLSQWQESLLNRPIFALDRRPLPVDAAPDGSIPRLSGTITFANTALAIFELPVAGGESGSTPTKSTVLGIGAKVAGWTIQSVTDERVQLAKDGQLRSLDIAFSKTWSRPARQAAAIRVLHGKRTNVFFQP